MQLFIWKIVKVKFLFTKYVKIILEKIKVRQMSTTNLFSQIKSRKNISLSKREHFDQQEKKNLILISDSPKGNSSKSNPSLSDSITLSGTWYQIPSNQEFLKVYQINWVINIVWKLTRAFSFICRLSKATLPLKKKGRGRKNMKLKYQLV